MLENLTYCKTLVTILVADKSILVTLISSKTEMLNWEVTATQNIRIILTLKFWKTKNVL